MEGTPEGKPGSATVETHHRLQLSLLEALEQILRQDKDRAVARETLARFVDFTRVHFQAEEALMALADYPDIDAHATAHGRFLARAREIQGAAADAETAQALAAVDGLATALRDHIKGFDEDFERWNGSRSPSPPGR
jgi:hemerythrin-like metal-binding protein